MAEIKPFQGITYNQELIENLSLVIAPPYDVISDEAREKLYQNSSYNIIRLIKGKPDPQGQQDSGSGILPLELRNSASENQYTRAAHYLRSWLQEGVLQTDKQPCLYIMEDEYSLPCSGIKLVRKGFTALIKLEEFGSGKILPHEKTLSKPKEDRLKLIQACQTNLSPIFSLYSDPDRRTNALLDEAKAENTPFIDILSQERVLHRVWRVTTPRIIQGIIEEMGPKYVLIADGHHRSETALNYCQQMRAELKADDKSREEKSAGCEVRGAEQNAQPSLTAQRTECHCNEPTTHNAQSLEEYSYVMMYFANMDDPGLTILPYYRLLKNLPAEKIRNWKSIVQPFFRVESFPFDGLITTERRAREKMFFHLSEKGRNCVPAYGLYMGMGDKNYYVISPYAGTDLAREIPGDQPMVCKRLDVTILDHLVINRILNSNTCETKEACLGFSHDPQETINAVNSEEYQMAIFLNPTPIHLVNEIASIGQQMPQKSTFFYPKLPTGLVLRKITK